ncbi:MAG: hypothetical protein EZS28_034605 [Streblomastix strix]|uniref:Uncharacterized protein n=1 Tax=Streblomastix strix TaxID=222440 RepID=A0A5J4UGQ6_9EUKA|nr:MAG: hypothetical protein EZS28_034605 [Streblomastix strix]
MKKMKEIRTFLVENGGFLKQANGILLQNISSSSSSSLNEKSDHVKGAILDILLQLAIAQNLKWNQNDLKELIKALETISHSDKKEYEDDSYEGKAKQLLPLLQLKISAQSQEQAQIVHCDECNRLREQLRRSEELRMKAEDELKKLRDSTAHSKPQQFMCPSCETRCEELISCLKCNKDRCRKCQVPCQGVKNYYVQSAVFNARRVLRAAVLIV